MRGRLFRADPGRGTTPARGAIRRVLAKVRDSAVSILETTSLADAARAEVAMESESAHATI